MGSKASQGYKERPCLKTKQTNQMTQGDGAFSPHSAMSGEVSEKVLMGQEATSVSPLSVSEEAGTAHTGPTSRKARAITKLLAVTKRTHPHSAGKSL